ncbi:hypothetical protein NDU88_005365 [Pleurodeles waltl]|uniref:Uncharacterized protein n=1 Tax=Pleurodeles waltl TaxID=8319 RepID=A0AAV7RM44_PLEWA|nr:hypothetical protein NDU88_005365 [Pleurodeles waltl]
MGNPEPYPVALRAEQRRLPHQPLTTKRKNPRSRRSHPGTKETTSGKQDASASPASGEAWQTQVRGVFGRRVWEDGRKWSTDSSWAVGVRECCRGEEDGRLREAGRRGRRGIQSRIQRLFELGGGDRPISRLQPRGKTQEAGGPIQGRRRQPPGSRTRVPAMLREKRGRRRCAGFSG